MPSSELLDINFKLQLIVNASFTEKPGKKSSKSDVCTRKGDKFYPYSYVQMWVVNFHSYPLPPQKLVQN